MGWKAAATSPWKQTLPVLRWGLQQERDLIGSDDHAHARQVGNRLLLNLRMMLRERDSHRRRNEQGGSRARSLGC
jgi:hypothetical protein